MLTCMLAYTPTHERTHIHTHARSRIHAFTYTQTQTCTHALTPDTHIHPHLQHTCTCTYVIYVHYTAPSDTQMQTRACTCKNTHNQCTGTYKYTMSSFSHCLFDQLALCKLTAKRPPVIYSTRSRWSWHVMFQGKCRTGKFEQISLNKAS